MNASRGGIKKRAFRIAALALSAAMIFLCCLFSPAPSPSSAALPQGFLDEVSGEAWFGGEEYLDFAAVEGAVEEMLSSPGLDAYADDPVVVAVIDTGVNTSHELFGAGTEDDVLLRDGDGNIVRRNTIANNNDVTDGGIDHHGTHVAGIVAQLIMRFGLSDYIKIMPVKAGQRKAGDSGNSFSLSDVKEAVSFALEKGADVVNLSIGTDKHSEWKEFITREDKESAVFVAAAGNYARSSAVFPFYPAAASGVIGVMNYEMSADGAVLHYVENGKGSNYGALYDVCAPGTDIVSADGATGGYKAMDGTSMASPVVAFAVALLELKCRADGFEADPEELADMFLLTFRDTLEHNGEEYPLLSLVGIAEAEFERDAAGDIYLAAAEDAEVSVSPEKVTLGADTTVTFSAECGYLSTGAVFEWSYTSGGLYMKAYGERVTVSLDARDIDGVAVELTVYAPDEVTVIARRTVVIEAEYFVPTAENSAVTLSVRPGEDGAVSLIGSDTLVLGVNTLTYASPDTEVVWFVNGREASREQTFTFSPSSDGVYTLTVTVNGIAIGDPVTVNAEGIRMPRDKIALIAGSVCGGAAGAGIIIAAGVLIVKKKKRAA